MKILKNKNSKIYHMYLNLILVLGFVVVLITVRIKNLFSF